MIIAAVLSERWSSAVFYKKKQREEGKRMKKKVLAFLLASTMVIEPFSVASAADFSDGMGQEAEMQFSDDAEDVPEVKNNADGVDQFSTDAAGENEDFVPQAQSDNEETNITWKVLDTDGDGYDDTLVISGIGDMLEYNGENYVPWHLYASGITHVIVEDGITSIGRYAFSNFKKLQNLSLGNGIKKIGSTAFENCESLQEVTIPEQVTEIGWYAFQGCSSLKKVNLSNSVTEIGRCAFKNCVELNEVNMSDNLVNIGEEAFYGCKNLSYIFFPKTLKTVGKKAFIRYIGRNALLVLSEIHYPGLQSDWNNITGVNERVEHEYTLSEKVHFSVYHDPKPATCTTPGYGGYWSCNTCGGKGYSDRECRNSIDTLPIIEPALDHDWDSGIITKLATETEEGVKTYTCRRCNETKTESIPKIPKQEDKLKVTGKSVEWNDYSTVEFTFQSNVKGTYYIEQVKRGGKAPTIDTSRAGTSIEANTDITVTVTDLPDYDVDIFVCVISDNDKSNYGAVMFQPISADRPQKISDAVKVGDSAIATVTGDIVTITGSGETYDECYWYANINKNNIKHVIIEEGVTSLGSSIFYGFSQVEDVKLPTSLKNIGYGAFEKCDSLKELTIPEGVTNIGNGIINSCTSIKKISLPSTLNTIPRLIDMESTGDMQLDEIVLNDGIKTLGNYAFWNFRNLKNIIIPESVTNIGESAFHGCTALSNLTLPDSITEIAGEAFSNCVSLGKVTLPKNLTLLGNDVFEYCNAEITFPSGLERIPELGMNATRKVNIPEGVKIIGEDAFWACSNLKEITLPSTITSIESGAFFNTSISGFNYPQNIDSIPINAFCGTKLTEFSVPPKVTEINDDAFYNCTDLVKISIPESVKYIGTDVFKNCRNLTIYGYKDTAAESYAKANNIKFISADYKVIFKDNGRTQKTEYVLEGENATPPSLKEKPGYTLSWDADYTNIQEDMVINAVWTKKDNGGGNTTIIVSPSETNKYTVTFKDRGKIVKTEKVKSGDAAEYPYINRNGYELSWDKDFSKVTANITVNAVWTVIKPEKVTSLTAESGKKSIALSWDETEYAGYYLVYRKADSEKEYTQVAKTTKILWTDSKAVPGTQYSYKVVAVRSLSGKKYQGAESDVVTTKIGTPQIGDTYSVGDLNYKLTGTKEVTVTGLAKVTDTLVIPSSVTISGKVYKVTAIQDKAFYRNEDIVNVTIGNNVVNVGKYAFYQCSGLETVKFGKRVAIINTCAFTQCPNLENVTLPSSIIKIGAKAFYQCTSIKIFKINGSALEYVGKKGLAVNKSVTLKLPKKVYTRYKKLIKASNIYSKTKFTKF